MFGMEQIVHAGMIVSNLAVLGMDQDAILRNLNNLHLSNQHLNQERYGAREILIARGQEKFASARQCKHLNPRRRCKEQQQKTFGGKLSNSF